MWILKRRLTELEKRVADLERKVQDQQLNKKIVASHAIEEINKAIMTTGKNKLII